MPNPLSRCLFCEHGNPDGARFCNACGSTLDLKPCDRCEAVNHWSALRCHKCGVSFGADAKSAKNPTPSVVSAAITAFPAANKAQIERVPSGADAVQDLRSSASANDKNQAHGEQQSNHSNAMASGREQSGLGLAVPPPPQRASRAEALHRFVTGTGTQRPSRITVLTMIAAVLLSAYLGSDSPTRVKDWAAGIAQQQDDGRVGGDGAAVVAGATDVTGGGGESPRPDFPDMGGQVPAQSSVAASDIEHESVAPQAVESTTPIGPPAAATPPGGTRTNLAAATVTTPPRAAAKPRKDVTVTSSDLYGPVDVRGGPRSMAVADMGYAAGKSRPVRRSTASTEKTRTKSQVTRQTAGIQKTKAKSPTKACTQPQRTRGLCR